MFSFKPKKPSNLLIDSSKLIINLNTFTTHYNVLWDNLIEKQQQAVLKDIFYIFDPAKDLILDEADIFNKTLHILHQKGLTHLHFPEVNLKRIIEFIEDRIIVKQCSIPKFVIYLNGLSCIGVNFTHLSEISKNNFMQKISTLSINFIHVPVLMSALFLFKINLSLDPIKGKFMDLILKNIKNTTNDKQSSNYETYVKILITWSRFGFTFEKVDQNLREVFMNVLCKHYDHLNINIQIDILKCLALWCVNNQGKIDDLLDKIIDNLGEKINSNQAKKILHIAIILHKSLPEKVAYGIFDIINQIDDNNFHDKYELFIYWSLYANSIVEHESKNFSHEPIKIHDLHSWMEDMITSRKLFDHMKDACVKNIIKLFEMNAKNKADTQIIYNNLLPIDIVIEREKPATTLAIFITGVDKDMDIYGIQQETLKKLLITNNIETIFVHASDWCHFDEENKLIYVRDILKQYSLLIDKPKVMLKAS